MALRNTLEVLTKSWFPALTKCMANLRHIQTVRILHRNKRSPFPAIWIDEVEYDGLRVPINSSLKIVCILERRTRPDLTVLQ